MTIRRNIPAKNSKGLLDVFHANSIQVLPPNRRKNQTIFKPGNILISLRNVNRAIIVNKASGDIVWILKVPTLNQHHVRMIPKGLPGAGNILLFDNGASSHYTKEKRSRSRILEVNPVNHKIVWRYKEPKAAPKNGLFSKKMSSAQRLPNGNTLILNSDNSRVFEVNQQGKIVWKHKAKKTKRGIHYRAYWAPDNWTNSDYFNWW